jgi:hypothetical protein
MTVTNLTARQVSVIVREYFDEIKKSKFIFDVVSVRFDDEEDTWEVSCELSSVFKEEPRHYRVAVTDESGEICALEELKKDTTTTLN